MKSLVDSIRSDLPTARFLSYSMAGKNLVRVLVDVTHAGDSRSDKSKILQGLTAGAKNKLSPVVGSFISQGSTEFGEKLSGIMGINRQIVPYKEDNRDDFHMYAKNMFMDSEQNIWNLKKTESGDLLINTNSIEDEDSLKELMESLSFNNIHSFEATASSSNIQPEAGDFVLYVSPQTMRTNSGFIVSEIVGGQKYHDFIVLSSEEEDEEIISQESVIAGFEVDDDDIEIADADNRMNAIHAAAKGESSLDDILSYYKSVFRRNPAYFEEFKRRLKEHTFV